MNIICHHGHFRCPRRSRYDRQYMIFNRKVRILSFMAVSRCTWIKETVGKSSACKFKNIWKECKNIKSCQVSRENCSDTSSWQEGKSQMGRVVEMELQDKRKRIPKRRWMGYATENLRSKQVSGKKKKDVQHWVWWKRAVWNMPSIYIGVQRLKEIAKKKFRIWFAFKVCIGTSTETRTAHRNNIAQQKRFLDRCS